MWSPSLVGDTTRFEKFVSLISVFVISNYCTVCYLLIYFYHICPFSRFAIAAQYVLLPSHLFHYAMLLCRMCIVLPSYCTWEYMECQWLDNFHVTINCHGNHVCYQAVDQLIMEGSVCRYWHVMRGVLKMEAEYQMRKGR